MDGFWALRVDTRRMKDWLMVVLAVFLAVCLAVNAYAAITAHPRNAMPLHCSHFSETADQEAPWCAPGIPGNY